VVTLGRRALVNLYTYVITLEIFTLLLEEPAQLPRQTRNLEIDVTVRRFSSPYMYERYPSKER
jgi:hypothetical protein